MANSYPRRDQASGIWKINNITKNIKDQGTYPQTSSQNTAIYSGGATPSSTVTMDTFQINTAGNAVDFGDLVAAIRPTANAGDFIRCIICGGADPDVNTMQYVNYASKGNTADFGDDQNTNQWKGGGGSNGTRSLWSAGTTPGTTNISSIIVQTLGNAVDYGDLTTATYGQAFGTNGNNIFASWSGGNDGSNTNRIETKDITSSGNNTDFGDLTVSYRYRYATNSATKNFIAGGEGTSVIDVFTLGSKGNSVDFGDITTAKSKGSGVSNGVTGVYGGGETPSPVAFQNVIESFTMSTFGNTSDFGDLTVARQLLSSNSNGHGGLQEQSQRAPELYSPTGTVVPRGLSVGNIGILAGGKLNPAGTVRNDIQFVHISTTGNSSNFGDLTASKYGAGGGSSSTRSLFMGGFVDPATSQTATDYFEFSTKGNAASFGSLTAARAFTSGCSNSTRALMMGGSGPAPGFTRSNVVDYFTIASIGNASDFGDLSTATSAAGATASSTRAIVAGGTAPGNTNVIEYFTIGSTGNATDFGDLTVARSYPQGLASSTRGCFGGGSPGVNTIDYVTIASTSNATDFGDLTVARSQSYGGMSNNTRGVFLPGTNPDNVTMDYITIASTGNAIDYGDPGVTGGDMTGTSNGHGGLS